MTILQLPPWYVAHRPHQEQAVEEIVEAYEDGARVVVLEAPTGSGKTLIAETVRQRLFGGKRTAYTCSTKSLQDQFARDYPYAKVLKGRGNYPTELYPDKFGLRWDRLSCEDCTKQLTTDGDCNWCVGIDSCPYELAKDKAWRSELAVINTSYLLSEANYVGKFSGLDLVIADECDLLDNAVIGFVSVEISARRVNMLGIGTPRKVTVRESWLEWVDHAIPVVKAKAREARESARKNPNNRTVREANYLSGLWSKINTLRNGIEGGGWIYTGTRDRVEFKPVWGNEVGEEVLWRHGKKWLLMSATVINAESLLSNIGWDISTGPYFVTVPSTFPVENRPIIYRPTANMKGSGDSEERELEWAKLIPAIEKIRADHPGQRILCHTVSYSLAEHLSRAFSDRVVTYRSAQERDGALQQYLATGGAIMFAPSMDRGIDLPDDACRVQVITKVPFANLGDKQVAARLYGSGQSGRLWYTTDAIRTLVQMCGRGVRHEEDKCVTYILDQQFEWKLWGGNRHLFPTWWKEALKWRE